MSKNYYFLSKKIKIEKFRDVEIKEKGSLKIETVNGVKRIKGSGIYDSYMFKAMKESSPDSNFYIRLNIKAPSIFCNYSIFGSNAKVIKALLEYRAFVYDGKIITSIDDFNFAECNDSLFEFGEKAAKEYLWQKISKMKKIPAEEKKYIFFEYEQWFEFNNTDAFLIPDLSFRKPKLIKNGNKIINPEINDLYEELFKINENNSLFFKYEVPNFIKFFSSINIYKIKSKIEEGLYSILSSGKKCLVKKEGISEKLSSAVRGTIVPNPFLDEDVIEVGTIFADYLYPEFKGLWNNSKELNFLISRGVLSIPKEIFKYDIDWLSEEEINEMKSKRKNSDIFDYYYPWWEDKYSFIPEENLEKIKKTINARRMDFYKHNKSDVDYYLLVGRNPTICQLSMISARPIFRDSIGNSVNNSTEKDNNIISSLNSYIDEESGEIKYRNYLEDCIAINTLVCDGMNADFDGDVLLIVALYTRESNIEAENLKPSLNYITVDSGNIRNKIPKEFLFAMKMIYEKDEVLTKKINDIIGLGDLDYEAASEEIKFISRDKYSEIFAILVDNVWKYGGGLSFLDMKNGLENGSINNQLVKDLESEGDIIDLLNKSDKDYSSSQSESFINKVKASNTTDISEAGYFYKKLISCMDNICISIDDCLSEGTEIKVSELLGENGKKIFDFKIKNMFIVELNKDYSRFEIFIEELKESNLETIHYRSPITCKEARKRCFCKKCCGSISSGGRDLYSDNIGIIATLAVTESSTQSSLSSMNNGLSENPNVILEKPFKTPPKSKFSDFIDEINSICDKMIDTNVESRWYEISLIGRVYKNPTSEENEDKYMSTTFLSSSPRTNDRIGAFLFKPSRSNLFNLLCGDSGYGNNFLIKSCKAKNLFGLF